MKPSVEPCIVESLIVGCQEQSPFKCSLDGSTANNLTTSHEKYACVFLFLLLIYFNIHNDKSTMTSDIFQERKSEQSCACAAHDTVPLNTPSVMAQKDLLKSP